MFVKILIFPQIAALYVIENEMLYFVKTTIEALDSKSSKNYLLLLERYRRAEITFNSS